MAEKPKGRMQGCTTETHSLVQHTPHGVVRREVRMKRKHAEPGSLEWEGVRRQTPRKKGQ